MRESFQSLPHLEVWWVHSSCWLWTETATRALVQNTYTWPSPFGFSTCASCFLMVWYLDSKSKHPKGHRQKPYHFLCPRIRRHSINLVIVIDLPRFKGREHHPFLSKDSVNGILKEVDRGKYNLSQGTIYQMSFMPWWKFYIYIWACKHK